MRAGIHKGADLIVALAYYQHRHRGNFMRQKITCRRDFILAPDANPLLLKNGLLLVPVKRRRMVNLGRNRTGLVEVLCRCVAQPVQHLGQRSIGMWILQHNAAKHKPDKDPV